MGIQKWESIDILSGLYFPTSRMGFWEGIFLMEISVVRLIVSPDQSSA